MAPDPSPEAPRDATDPFGDLAPPPAYEGRYEGHGLADGEPDDVSAAAGRDGWSTGVPIIEVEGLSRVFYTGGTQVDALVDVDLRVDEGEFVAVMGSSGSGKSTLMNILGCLDTPTAGRYVLDGTDVATLRGAAQARVRNRTIGFVFQSFNLIPRTSAAANVELPLMYAGVGRRERKRRALEALDAVGLADRAHHTPTQLSGGQQQRVAVARAIVGEPAMVLADEPTGNLDSRSTHDVLRVLSDLHDAGRTVVVITHEHDVAGWAGRTVVMHDGRVASDERQVPHRPVAYEPSLPVGSGAHL